ncbi:MAG: 16S rRNA (uracil(1498)-N(3))-methyltransferase [Hyphomicrobiales bacterium]|nr:16S rRNA (uracil(1498)-N(3))-methyltransferase [Hyphomicrobiales bacterium]
MSRYDFTATRLHVEAPLAIDAPVEIAADQANYLLNVLRLGEGAHVLLFNGRDGEWRAEITQTRKRAATLRPLERTRMQEKGPDIDLCFAPLKHARLDYLVQKAVEMGAARLRPVITRRTQASRINLERMRANVVEAAEQCGVIAVPEVCAEAPLERVLAQWPDDRALIFCDEDAAGADPLAVLRAGGWRCPAAVLIGPEGGFDEAERAAILRLPNVARISLGPRILRADTAAVAALAVAQLAFGDWISGD